MHRLMGICSNRSCGGCRDLPVTSLALRGDWESASSAQCPSQKNTKTVRLQQFWSLRFGEPLSDRTQHSERLGDGKTRDGYPLALGRVSLDSGEVALAGRQTKGPTRNPPIDPKYKPRQPLWGAPGSMANSSLCIVPSRFKNASTASDCQAYQSKLITQRP